MGAAREVDLNLLCKNWAYIILYGLVGTFINFLGLFCFLFVFKGIIFSKLIPEMTQNHGLSDNNMLLLSSTLTATDTVAVLSLLPKHDFPKIHSIIFGEGLLNDAVAIILFNMSKKLISTHQHLDLFSGSGLLTLIKEFLVSISLSVMVGLLIGYLFLYIARRAPFEKMKRGTAEICLIFVLGFFSFYLAENLGFSGIISIFCFVVVAANYSQKFLSEKTFQSIDSLFKSGAFLAESIAFVYLGFQSFQVFAADDFGKIFFLSGFAILAIGVIRWISIGMPAFLFLCYEDLRVEPSELILIWYSGLIRGAVSVALIFSFHADKTDQVLRKVVLLVSLITSLAFGSASLFVTKKLGFGETNMR